jgi:hypothetical protein
VHISRRMVSPSRANCSAAKRPAVLFKVIVAMPATPKRRGHPLAPPRQRNRLLEVKADLSGEKQIG